MFRRRRPTREIAFSFDSFLDVVANVVGIILRLILVAWVGARSYKVFVPPPPPPPEPPADLVPLLDPSDPLTEQIERRRRELAEVQARLLEEVRRFDKERKDQGDAARTLEELRGQLAALTAEESSLDAAAHDKGKGTQAAALTLDELRQRSARLQDQIKELQNGPPVSKTLRYRTPVSQPVHSEEWMFECREGKITLIDIGTLLDEASRGMRSRAEELRDRWEFNDVTAPVGAFRLRYTVERRRSAFDGPGGAAMAQPSIRYGLTAWELEPVDPRRGETLEAALAPGSEFRRVADHLDPRQVTVTLWVYPDSFPLYRRLRDYLHDHDIAVAGRAIPFGAAIAASREGSASRAQ
jgi:hypothetical protein